MTGTSYRTIVADPPWQFESAATKADARKHYGTMTLSEIAALPVAEIKASPLGPRALAKQYGVHRQTIGNIRSGKTWRDVEPATLRENAASARLLPTESRAA